MHSESTPRARASVAASDLFSNDLREDVLIEGEIGHQALELLSFAFSSRSCRSSRISVLPRFAYFFFHT